MPLTDQDYNAFARRLADGFSRRAKGLDDTARRLVGVRPADHILTGFLTPANEDDDDELRRSALKETLAPDPSAEDLPRDSAYEQTAAGVEWLAPISSFDGGSLHVRVACALYVRRLPTFEEQCDNLVWRRRHQNQAAGSPNDVQPRYCELVPVWTREHLRPLDLEIQLPDLWQRRRMPVPLSDQFTKAWAEVEMTGLYPGRRPLELNEADLVSDITFRQALARFQSGDQPVTWRPAVDARLVSIPTEPGSIRVAVRCVNQSTRISPRSLDYVDPNLYGISLAVDIPKAAYQPTVFRELPASFRYNRAMPGIGINSHVSASEGSTSVQLIVDTVPLTVIDRLEQRDIAGVDISFATLASDPLPSLKRIRDAMHLYDADRWQTKLDSLKGEERDDAQRARDQFNEEVARLNRGIALLSSPEYGVARRAFSLMNEAMRRSSRFPAWRLFQVVFVVTQLPGLASREYSELRKEGDDDVDILWFAAGGGKTEAFLGLILWQAFFDRLRGKAFGVTALVRFPLRLLSFQQLQRLGRGLAAAELIRASENLPGAPFSMGYLAGRNVTPNTVNDEMDARFRARGVDQRFQKIFRCPFPECGGVVTLRYESELRRISHVCQNRACPGRGAALPIFVVDDDVYSYLPTLVVSTVDKLALLGHNQRFANIFGRIEVVCPKHGATFRGSNRLCEAAKTLGAGKSADKCGTATLDAGPFHDLAPALLVQDELHLLTEELGTFDAHYETGTMALVQALGGKPWKIVAATATIEAYRQHAWQLYLKRSRQFPGPGPEAYESFYYHQNPKRIGRIFIGLVGIGLKHTPAVTRALSLLYLEVQAAREMFEANPESAAREYGIQPLSPHEIRELIFAYELPLTYVLTRKGSDKVAEAIEHRVKAELRQAAPLHGELLIDMFNGGVEISEMIEAMEQIQRADPQGDPAVRIRGLVTTNIIGHGVDVDRFNIIVFAGFPRMVAEYIQASARIGRTFPGLSIFVATPQSERDRSMFDRFAKFHEYLDRLVDPSAVNRWPEPALIRTVPGLLCGYIMGIAAARAHKAFPTVEKVQQEYGRPGAESLNEASLSDWMKVSYGAALAPSGRYTERLIAQTRNKYREVVNSPTHLGGRPRSLGMHLGSMTSLRDVDDPAFISIDRDEDEAILRKLTRG